MRITTARVFNSQPADSRFQVWELLSENVFNHVLQILSHIIVISIISTIIYISCNMEVRTIKVTSFPDGKTSLLIDLLETNEPDLAV